MSRSIEVKIIGDASSLGRAFAQAGIAVDGFGRSAHGFGRSLAMVGTAALATGAVLGGALAAGAVFSLKKFAEFEQALNTFQSVAGATGDEMERVSDRAKELGSDLDLPGASAKDAAEAMSELAKGGLDVGDSMDAAKAAIQLATAAQVDNAHAAEIMADALNTFNLEGTDASHVADLLANAANKTTASIDDMAMALKPVGGIAHALGLSIDDTVTALAMMADAGIKGSDAGTSLKTMLLQLSAPTDKAAAAMKDLGFNAFDMQGNLKPLPALIEQWNTATAGLTDQQRLAAEKIIFGNDAIRAAGAILDQQPSKWDAFKDAMMRSGSAAEIAGSKSKGLQGSFDALNSAAETLAIAVGEKLAPHVETAVRRFGDWVAKISEADSLSGMLAAAVEGVGDVFRDVGGIIMDALGQINWAKVAEGAGELLSGLLSLIGKIDWPAVTAAIGTGLGNAIKQVNWGAVLKTILTAFGTLAQSIDAVFGSPIQKMLREAAAGYLEFAASVLDAFAKVAEIAGTIDDIGGILGKSPFHDLADSARDSADGLRSSAAEARNWMTPAEQLVQKQHELAVETGKTSAAWESMVVQMRSGDPFGQLATATLPQLATALANTKTKFDLTDVAVLTLTQSLGRVPTTVETQALLRDPEARAALSAWLAQLGLAPKDVETVARLLAEGAIRTAGELKGVIDELSSKEAKPTARLNDQPLRATAAAIPPFLTGLTGQMTAAGNTMGTGTTRGLQTGLAPTRPQTSTFFNGVRTLVAGMAGPFNSAANTVGGRAAAGLKTGMNPMQGHARTETNEAKAAISGQAGGFRSVGSTLGSSVTSGFMAGIGGLVSAAANAVTAAINAARAAAAAGSPSKHMWRLGEDMMSGLKLGWEKERPQFQTVTKETVEKAIRAMDAARQGCRLTTAIGAEMGSHLVEGFQDGAGMGGAGDGLANPLIGATGLLVPPPPGGFGGGGGAAPVHGVPAGALAPGPRPYVPVLTDPVPRQTVIVNVSGSVVSERDLVYAVRDGLAGLGASTPTLWGARA
jgi:TP901 family phage tail tape measure protein